MIDFKVDGVQHGRPFVRVPDQKDTHSPAVIHGTGGNGMARKLFNLDSSSCYFCEEINNNRFPDEFVRNCGIVNRVLEQCDNFVAVPSLSPITLGHVLIIPKYHVTSMMQVDRAMMSELENFTNKIMKIIAINIGAPIIFEHGIGEGKAGGCGVNHAHLHILPMKPDSASNLQLIIDEQFSFSGATSLVELLSSGGNKKSYLLFGQNLKEIFYFYDENIPSQYLRRLIAKEMARLLWNWKEMYGWLDFMNTYKVLSNSRYSFQCKHK